MEVMELEEERAEEEEKPEGERPRWSSLRGTKSWRAEEEKV